MNKKFMQINIILQLTKINKKKYIYMYLSDPIKIFKLK